MTNNERLTDEDRRTIDMFVSMLAGLRVGEHGPTSDNHLGYLNPLAKLCLDVEAITMVGYTPEEILLHRVARLTSDLITRVVLAGGDAIVREWLIARSELLRVRSVAEGPAEGRRV
jgi:hypothetical protein